MALSTGQRSIRIGTADRPAYGQTRRRLVVWVGGEPVAEAVGIDEYGTNRQLASLLKDSAGQMIAADGAIPAPYASFAFLPFREVVSGPYARVVLERYDGDASSIWRDEPRAVELNARLRRFPGIGQRKAVMAVEILHRDLSVKIRDLSGSDIAYDVHVRRVFLRTRLAEV